MSNLIYKQAAIDAIKAEPINGWVKDHLIGEIDALPSTQPEIIRCKECKHFHYDMPYVIQGIPVLGHEVCDAWGDGCKTDENGYCFLAERRTDETD